MIELFEKIIFTWRINFFLNVLILSDHKVPLFVNPELFLY